ncbi:hypothetical protein ACOMHN_051017 [Nucella lapillus]
MTTNNSSRSAHTMLVNKGQRWAAVSLTLAPPAVVQCVRQVPEPPASGQCVNGSFLVDGAARTPEGAVK